MSEATDRYVKANQALDAATRDVEQMLHVIVGVADHLRDGRWRKRVVGGSGGFSYPEMTNAPDFPVQEHQWPQFQKLRTAMQAWHRVKLDVENAWRAMTDAEQKAMVPPKF
jgi:hypothetical protein